MAQIETSGASSSAAWPALPYIGWQDTCTTLHMWTQIVGKIRLAQEPMLNQWWQVPLYISARGLTTSAIPYRGGAFDIEFDFIDHRLLIRTSEDKAEVLPLVPRSVAAFHAALMAALRSLGIDVRIWTMPVEIPSPIRFEKDETHASYDPEAAQLVLEYEDGATEVVATGDEGWRATADGPITASGIYAGEDYDARRAMRDVVATTRG